MNERTGVITFKGGPLTLVGDEVRVGDRAADFTVLDGDLNSVSLSEFGGKVIVIAAVPSLDTPVCDIQTRRFNQEAAALGEGVLILTISMDLPFAQARWCGAAGVERVKTLSDHRDAAFGRAYGVLIKELRLLTRAVFVVGLDGVVRHAQIVSEITDEPDYDAALRMVRDVV